MNIAIIGGGNIGTLLAAELSMGRGNNIRIYSSRPTEWNEYIQVKDGNNKLLYMSERIGMCSNCLKDVLENVQIVFVTVPSFLFKNMAEQMEPYCKRGMIICFLPANGGAEFYFQASRQKGVILCAFERVHVTARIVEYGKSVRQLSRKQMVRVAALPNKYLSSKEFAEQIEDLLHIKCEPLPNYLCATLAPSNPILHTTRLYQLFKDYEGKGYAQVKYMYDTWDDESSSCMFICDDELQDICKSLDQLDLTAVPSLKKYYESNTIYELTRKMKSIESFHGVEAPMVLHDDGWHPDFSHRFFMADFEYGLHTIQEIGNICGVDIPEINKIFNWYKKVSGRKCKDILLNYTKKQLYELYN